MKLSPQAQSRLLRVLAICWHLYHAHACYDASRLRDLSGILFAYCLLFPGLIILTMRFAIAERGFGRCHHGAYALSIGFGFSPLLVLPLAGMMLFPSDNYRWGDTGPPLLRVRDILIQRLEGYHPFKVAERKFFGRVNSDINPKTQSRQNKIRRDQEDLILQIDDPKDGRSRLQLNVTMAVFSDQHVAKSELYRYINSPSNNRGGLFFENEHGYDLLALTAHDVWGVTDNWLIHIRFSLDPRKGRNSAAGASGVYTDYKWLVGWAEFMQDVWRQAVRAKFEERRVVPVAPGVSKNWVEGDKMMEQPSSPTDVRNGPTDQVVK